MILPYYPNNLPNPHEIPESIEGLPNKGCFGKKAGMYILYQ